MPFSTHSFDKKVLIFKTFSKNVQFLSLEFWHCLWNSSSKRARNFIFLVSYKTITNHLLKTIVSQTICWISNWDHLRIKSYPQWNFSSKPQMEYFHPSRLPTLTSCSLPTVPADRVGQKPLEYLILRQF